MKPTGRTPAAKWIHTALAAVITAVLAVTPTLAQDDLDKIRQAAEQGDADAQFKLAVMYFNGSGVIKDDAEAVRWVRSAAEQGHARAQVTLGNMYDDGWGGIKDEAKAVRWYRMAAEQREARALNETLVMVPHYSVGE